MDYPPLFYDLRQFPQDKSALLATPWSKSQKEILAGVSTSTVLHHLGGTEEGEEASRS